MNTTKAISLRAVALGLACAFLATAASAEKPDWAGQGKNKGGPDRAEQRPERAEPQPGKPSQPAARQAEPGRAAPRGAGEIRAGGYFTDAQRPVLQGYFHDQYQRGSCPPGLAKKNNGCMPPGQARKWAVGQPLPRDVVFYSLPPAIVVQLGAPPAGHRYVRVASDILLIAIGTQLVVDAMQDLGRM